MPRRRFRGVRPAVEGFYSQALHQCVNIQPPDLEAFLHQQALQYPAACGRESHVQIVDAVDQLQVRVRHWAGLVVDAATADPGTMACRLTFNLAKRSIIFLCSATDPSFRARGTKIVLQRQFSDLACRVFTSMIGCGSAFAASPNTLSRPQEADRATA